MHPSARRLVRILPRSVVAPSKVRVAPAPAPSRKETITLIDILQQRKTHAGDDFPQNLRIEPVITKSTFKEVPKDVRRDLKHLVKEM
ncbi:hypothetical protein JAAARDRAFT_31570 [Jaapia argillacea MUCL 33604]|uniref:Uncharacterized protein n=1 Tax=Jaapia argillacea MUCL 33604 TaxID=933084 RepID=A0A067QDC7_9AGAM|nr:hypothetical protein JAAARDRAFT_31570 [Jaapia argillacea MUCL 33604]